MLAMLTLSLLQAWVLGAAWHGRLKSQTLAPAVVPSLGEAVSRPSTPSASNARPATSVRGRHARVAHVSSIGGHDARLLQEAGLNVHAQPMRSAKRRHGRGTDGDGGGNRSFVDAFRPLPSAEQMASTDVLWGHWSSHLLFFDSRLRRGQMVNFIMGLEHETLGTPHALALTHQRCVRTYGLRTCNFTSAQLVLHSHRDVGRLESLFGDEELSQLASWHEITSDKVRSVWLAKQSTYHRSLTPHVATMFEGKQLLSSHDPLPAGLWVVQPWPTKPILWRHHRFILRTWLLVPSVLPLRVYMLQDAWAHVVAKPYRPDQLMRNYRDRCVHLWTTSSCSVTHSHRVLRSNHEAFIEGIVGLPTTGKDAGLDGGSWWRKRVWPALEDAATRALATTWRDLAMYERLLRTSPDVPPYRRVATLTLDWIIDEGGRPVLLDVDVHGAVADDALPLSHKYALDALRLLGVNGYDRSRYGAMAHTVVDNFCAQRAAGSVGIRGNREPCDAAGRAALHDLIDEANNAGAFARIFPPVGPKGCGQYCAFLEPLPPEAAPGGRATPPRRWPSESSDEHARSVRLPGGQGQSQKTGSREDRLTWAFLRAHHGILPRRSMLPQGRRAAK